MKYTPIPKDVNDPSLEIDHEFVSKLPKTLIGEYFYLLHKRRELAYQGIERNISDHLIKWS